MTHHQIYLGLGSNVERETHIEIALKMLEEHLENIRCSPVYESISLDGDHPPFYNLVMSATTDLDLRELVKWLKGIEHLHGRRSGKQRLIALDIDLLLFDGLTGDVEGIQLPILAMAVLPLPYGRVYEGYGSDVLRLPRCDD